MRIKVMSITLMVLVGVFAGCSAKKINENVDTVTEDVRQFGDKAIEKH